MSGEEPGSRVLNSRFGVRMVDLDKGNVELVRRGKLEMRRVNVLTRINAGG